MMEPVVITTTTNESKKNGGGGGGVEHINMNNLASGTTMMKEETNNNNNNNGGAVKFIKQAKQVTSQLKLFRMSVNRSYIFSLKGLIRLLIIVFQFAAWVSLLSIVKAEYLRIFSFNGSAIAYLVFSLGGFLSSIVIFIVFALDLIKRPPIIWIPLMDAAFIVPMIILGVFCAINETYYNDPLYESYARVVLNRGAAASAGFFACSLGVLYFVSTILNFKI